MALHKLFCKNLREARLEAGLSQKEFADKLGVSESYISQILSGRKAPGLKVVEKLAKCLKIKPDQLLRQPAQIR